MVAATTISLISRYYLLYAVIMICRPRFDAFDYDAVLSSIEPLARSSITFAFINTDHFIFYWRYGAE
jgi:hypothetical protein